MPTQLTLDTEGHLHTVDGDELLTPSQVARRFGVSTERPSRWARSYGPDHEHPYPSHVAGQHLVVDGRLRIRASAIDAWVKELHPDGQVRRGRRRSVE